MTSITTTLEKKSRSSIEISRTNACKNTHGSGLLILSMRLGNISPYGKPLVTINPYTKKLHTINLMTYFFCIRIKCRKYFHMLNKENIEKYKEYIDEGGIYYVFRIRKSILLFSLVLIVRFDSISLIFNL